MRSFAILAVGVALICGARWLYRWSVRRSRDAEREKAQQIFYRRREWLEAKFMQIAGSRGSPRGLEWVDVEYDNEVSFARDRRTNELTALVGISIQFEATPGGGMEEVEAVANRKAATSVFRYRGGEWSTDGRAIFNLNPIEAIEYYHQELESVE